MAEQKVEAPAAPAAVVETPETILGGAKVTPAAAPEAGKVTNPAVPDPAKPAELGPDGKPIETKPEVKTGAPEKYETFKLPDGITLDAAVAEKFTGVAKELNLTQEQAQKLVDFQAAQAQSAVDARLAEFKTQQETWQKQSKDFLGADSEKKLALAARARNSFGTPELTKFLNESGLGDHPEVVKLFVKMGEKVSEDPVIDGNKNGAEKTAAEVMYGKVGK